MGEELIGPALALRGQRLLDRGRLDKALADAEKAFVPPQPKKAGAKQKAGTKKAAKKPTPVKAKSAKKKTTTKRLAA